MALKDVLWQEMSSSCVLSRSACSEQRSCCEVPLTELSREHEHSVLACRGYVVKPQTCRFPALVGAWALNEMACVR